MSFPKQSDIEVPLLQVLLDIGGSAKPKEIYPKIAEYFPELTPDEQEEYMESSPAVRKWWNSVQWARQNLVMRGEIDGSEHGVWKLTDAGRVRLTSNPKRIPKIEGDGAPWSDEELQASVESYLEMLRCDREGIKFVKVDQYRKLKKRFGRKLKAYERRAQNISYVLELKGRSYCRGLLPLSNVGTGVIERLEEVIAQAEGVSNDHSAFFNYKVRKLRSKSTGKHGAPPTGNKNPKKRNESLARFERDSAIVAWILDEANGKCEYCGRAAPFKRITEEAYLEVHHVLRLADGGSDTHTNAVALCPNCHRALHHSSDRVAREDKIYERVARLKRE